MAGLAAAECPHFQRGWLETSEKTQDHFSFSGEPETTTTAAIISCAETKQNAGNQLGICHLERVLKNAIEEAFLTVCSTPGLARHSVANITHERPSDQVGNITSDLLTPTTIML